MARNLNEDFTPESVTASVIALLSPELRAQIASNLEALANDPSKVQAKRAKKGEELEAADVLRGRLHKLADRVNNVGK